jgi:hypothetical protein
VEARGVIGRRFSARSSELLPNLSGPIFLSPPPSYGLSGIPRVFASGDFNGDGTPDFVVALYDGSLGSLNVLKGNGDGTFQPAVSYSAGGGYVAVGEFNNDGRLDLVTPNAVLLGNGDGTFQSPIAYVGGGSPLAVGDFNRDGKLDLVTADAVLLGNGDGTFQNPIAHNGGGSQIAVADFSRDGKLDVALGGAGGVSVLLGNGDGTFQAPVTVISADASAIGVEDLNRDDRLDLVTASSNGLISVLLGNGDGTFLSPVSYPSGVQAGSPSLVVADINDDNHPDIAALLSCVDIGIQTNCNSGISILYGNGDGTFRAPMIYTPAGCCFGMSMAAEDLNADGKLDLAVANRCTNPSCTNDGNLSVLLAETDGSFPAGTIFTSGGGGSVATGDANGDGNLDMITPTAVLLGDGHGIFQAAIAHASGGLNPQSVAVGDLNGDGKLDAVVANLCSDGSCTAGSVGVLLGNKDGTFQNASSYVLGGLDSDSVAIGDFNGDGKLDLAVANDCTDNSCTSGSISVLFGNGDGTFQSPQTIGSGGNAALSLAVGDFNGDGKPDLAVAAGCASGTDCFYESGVVTLLLGNGDGSFQAPLSYETWGGVCSIGSNYVVAADLNGDGQLDLAVAGSSVGCAGMVSILLGNGDGTFQPAVNMTAGSGANLLLSLAVADFNGDVNPDLAVAKECRDNIGCSDGGLQVLLGSGDGTFGSVEGEQLFFSSLAVGDLNNDGKPDIVGGSLYVSGLGVVLNNAGFLSATTTTLASSLNPASFGQLVIFTATVISKGSGTPTGSATFSDGSTVLGTVPLSGGTAQFSTATLAVGLHSINAAYSGDANFAASTSAPLNQVVNQATSTTTLVSSVNPSMVGQCVTFTATVVPQYSGTPTGTVTFKNGTKTMGKVRLRGGQAKFNKVFNSAGTKSITAVYSGDANFAASTSAPLNQVVTKPPSVRRKLRVWQ